MELISFEEAISVVLQGKKNWGSEFVSLDSALGRITTIPWLNDRDLPPFDRVMMDGIAIRFSDFEQGIRNFKKIGVSPAGTAPLSVENIGECIEIMTGAVCAKGADTIIRYEDITWTEDVAHINLESIKKGQNIHVQGSDQPKDTYLLPANTLIRDAEIALAASLGLTQIPVKSLPKTLVISTGDELVPIYETPLPFQIRKSNIHQLKALLLKWCIIPDSWHLEDEYNTIKRKMQDALEQYDLILLSGAVSKGKFDFIPQVLDDLGVKKSFHRVAQRPGKPFWFGQSNETTIFAFPGNPVSTYMCSHVYLDRWLHQSLLGLEPSKKYAKIAEDYQFKPPLDYFLQVRLESKECELWAYPESGNGSGDFTNLVKVNGFLRLPADQTEFKKGDVLECIPFQ